MAASKKTSKKGFIDGAPLFTRETFLFSTSGFLAAGLAFSLCALQAVQSDGCFGILLIGTAVVGFAASCVNMAANDALASTKGKVALSCVVACLCLAAAVSACFDVHAWIPCLCAFFGTMLLLSIWIGFLCCQTHGATNAMLMLSLALFGFVFLTAFLLDARYRYLLVVGLCLVSLLFVLGSTKLYGVRYEEYYRPARESRRRYREGRRNFSKLVFDGIVLAFSLVYVVDLCSVLSLSTAPVIGGGPQHWRDCLLVSCVLTPTGGLNAG